MNDRKDLPPRVLEIIVTSVDDAIAAARGGAGRLEIISNFAVGGLTPAIELVQEIQAVVAIPLRVMLRASEGFELTSEAEFETLCREAQAFDRLGVDGLVLGFLRQGDIDFVSLRAILSQAPNLKVTFHRAFEVLQEPFRAVESLKQFKQIDRILTSGAVENGQPNVGFLNTLQQCAAPEITILVGGGLDLHKLERLCAEPALREFHLGRALRQGGQIAGGVCADKVQAMRQIIG